MLYFRSITLSSHPHNLPLKPQPNGDALAVFAFGFQHQILTFKWFTKNPKIKVHKNPKH